MKPEMTNFRALAANLVAEGEVCDLAQADVSTQTETGTEIAPLIQQIGDMSIAEIDRLMAELQEAKSYLQSEGERIERETVRYTNLTQMASFTAKIIFPNGIPRATNKTLPKSPRLRPRTTSVRSGKVITAVSGIPPNSVRRLMPLRGRQRTRRYNNNAGAQRFFGIRVGRLFRKIAAENGTRRAAALALCVSLCA
jgi:hypothetical protein